MFGESGRRPTGEQLSQHSVLEPAAFGCPVMFGPQFRNSRDAELLLQDGAAISVTNAAGAADALRAWLTSDDAAERRAAGEHARQRVESGLGAADRAMELVLGLLHR